MPAERPYTDTRGTTMTARPRIRTLALLAAGGLAAAALAPASGAGATTGGDDRPAFEARAGGGWTRVSTGPVDTLSEITAQRTGDGVLHTV